MWAVGANTVPAVLSSPLRGRGGSLETASRRFPWQLGVHMCILSARALGADSGGGGGRGRHGSSLSARGPKAAAAGVGRV